MNKMPVTSFKKKQLAFLEKELETCDNRDLEVYIKKCMSILTERKPTDDRYIYDENIFHQLLPYARSLRSTGIGVKILTYTFTNDTIEVGKLNRQMAEEGQFHGRTSMYHILNGFVELGVLQVAGNTVKEYYLIDKHQPFKNVVRDIELKLEELRNFTLEEKEIVA
jgi:hypothetical protein